MSLYGRQRRSWTTDPDIPSNGSLGSVAVTPETALRASATWACLRLRADLVSTLPIDVFRQIGKRTVEVEKPPFFVAPSGNDVGILEWLYSSQFDLDRYGNSLGVIAAWGADGRPKQVELKEAGRWSMTFNRTTGVYGYRLDGKEIDPHDVWHERQFTVAGVPWGLSPIAYAAWTTGTYLSSQQFALQWYGNGVAPSGIMQNTQKVVSDKDSDGLKNRFKAASASRDLVVLGKDWEFTPYAGLAADATWVTSQAAGAQDMCRYYGVPADMVDVDSSTGKITYANITQRNLQLLVVNLGPTMRRREDVFTRKLVAPERFVKFNDEAMLRMDAKGKLELLGLGVEARLYAPSEARDLLDLPPFTPAQLVEFQTLFPAKAGPKDSTEGAIA